MLSFELLCFIEQRQVKVVQISPNSSFVALGQPLKLNVTVTVNVTDGRFYRRDYIHIRWSFRRFSSTSFEELTMNKWRLYRDRAYRVYPYSYNSRASIVNTATLVLANTTLNDTGTYQCYVESRGFWFYWRSQRLYFNVTIEGR